MSSPNSDVLYNTCLSENENNKDPLVTLEEIKKSNLNRLVIGHLNINSLRNKFESLKLLIKGNIDNPRAKAVFRDGVGV